MNPTLFDRFFEHQIGEFCVSPAAVIPRSYNPVLMQVIRRMVIQHSNGEFTGEYIVRVVSRDGCPSESLLQVSEFELVGKPKVEPEAPKCG